MFKVDNRKLHRWTRLALIVAVFPLVSRAVTPSRSVIEQHMDRSVEIYGRYAPVRLPIMNGVTIWNPASIRVSPRGEIFVANYVGEIYRIVDTDGDGLEDTAISFCNVTENGLRYPTTLAFHGSDLYVGTSQEIRVYEGADRDGPSRQSRTLLKLPCSDDTRDWTFGMCFGPDGYLYVNLSTDSYNPKPALDSNGWRGSLLRISPDGKEIQRFATGLRFAPGMAFDPAGNLFFSDNEGGGNPTEELNIARRGDFYGHNPSKFSASASIPPLISLTSGRGACGIAFNSSSNDFGGAAGELFVAFWGAGGINRDGSLARLKLWRDQDQTLRAREIPFCNWLSKVYDLAFGPSGDLYATQFGPTPIPMTPSLTPTGAVYRIIPAPWITSTYDHPLFSTLPRIRGNAEHGRQLFSERGCSQCHALDGTTDLLGPNLISLGGGHMDYPSALEAVLKPSKSIRTGYEAEIIQTDDDILEGRIITSDARALTLMVAGNKMVTVPRAQIRSHRSSQVSLMPEGLLTGLDDAALQDLFAYLGIQEIPYRVRWRYRVAALVLLCGTIGVNAWCLGKALK